jgi:cytochrome c oxidase subunit 2
MISPALRRLSPDRRALLLTLIAMLAIGLGTAPSALADAISPESGGSPNANDIDTLYKIVLYIAIVIFVGVEGALVWSLVKYRHRRGGPAPAQIRGNTPLELGWTVGAALILVAITVVTFVYLGDITNPPPSKAGGLQAARGVKFATVDQKAPPGGKALHIEVNGQQYIWRYDYPFKKLTFSYHEMVVPIGTTVTLGITSSDVIHSWWIPKLGGKMDGVPGYTNQTWFRIDKPGVFKGACTELCGEGHADMRAQVRALPVDEFQAWAEKQAADIEESGKLLAEARKAREAQNKSGGGAQ